MTRADLSGNHPPYIPDFTANVAVQYKHPSGPMARVEWLFTGRAFYDDHNTDYGAQSSYGLLNARIGYEKARWGIWLYGKNLTDKEYYAYKIPTLGVGFPGEPRSLGIMASVSF
jgi:iron complex outermembrane receptor protein